LDIDRYFLHWRQQRADRHESLTPFVLPLILPEPTLDYLDGAGPELYQQVLFAVSSRDFFADNQKHNVIYDLVREADRYSTQKDIGDPIAAGASGALGVPVERHVMDAIRRLARSQKWLCNKRGARLWVMDDSV